VKHACAVEPNVMKIWWVASGNTPFCQRCRMSRGRSGASHSRLRNFVGLIGLCIGLAGGTRPTSISSAADVKNAVHIASVSMVSLVWKRNATCSRSAIVARPRPRPSRCHVVPVQTTPMHPYALETKRLRRRLSECTGLARHEFPERSHARHTPRISKHSAASHEVAEHLG
jgi:hypothetical protein